MSAIAILGGALDRWRWLQRWQTQQLLALSPQPVGGLHIPDPRKQWPAHAVRVIATSGALQLRIQRQSQLGLGASLGCLKEVQRALLQGGLHPAGTGKVAVDLGADHTRMTTVHRYAGVLKDGAQLEGKQDVGQLGLTVRPKELAVVLLAHQILAVDSPKEMCRRTDHHNATGRAVLQSIQQQIREQKVSQMIDTELLLKAIGCEGPGTGHNAGIIDQYIQPGFLRLEALHEISHRLQGAQIQGAIEELLVATAIHDIQSCGLTPTGIPTGHVDAGTPLGQLEDRLLANARVAAGDDDHLAIDAIGLPVGRSLDALAQQPHEEQYAQNNQEYQHGPGPETPEAESLLHRFGSGIEARWEYCSWH